jgi:hypothetical protein
MGRKKRLRPFIPLFMVFATTAVLGQVPTGGIAGTVHDRSGGAVPGTQLILKATATSALRATTTSTEGSYEFLELRPGIYDLVAEAKGFRRTVVRSILVNVGLVVHLDVTLDVGDVTETVEVKAETPLVEPDKASTSLSTCMSRTPLSCVPASQLSAQL